MKINWEKYKTFLLALITIFYIFACWIDPLVRPSQELLGYPWYVQIISAHLALVFSSLIVILLFLVLLLLQ